MNRFWISAILAAQRLGYEFHLACNMEGIEPEKWDNGCKQYGIITHQIDFDRNPLSWKNLSARKQLLELLKREKFDIVHCNTPIGGVLGRLCSRKAGVPFVIYQAHGFHFWKGAPLKNWLIYYPVEKYLSRYNDVLITINEEDFAIAKKFVKEKAVLVHGVGVDLNQFNQREQDKRLLRKKLGIPSDAFVMISVGEVNSNKNHRVVVEAMKSLRNNNIYYLICGEGSEKENLLNIVRMYNLEERIKFLGFRTDVNQLLLQSDLFVFPSKREGLSVALMEAMATGLPCVASNIRGNTDLLPKSEYLFEPNDEKVLARLLINAYNGKSIKEELMKNKETIEKYSIDTVINEMKQIYKVIC